MDTDDLSKEAYEGIIIEAEKLTHDLTLHYGMLSYDCKEETEYIDKAEKTNKKNAASGCLQVSRRVMLKSTRER